MASTSCPRPASHEAKGAQLALSKAAPCASTTASGLLLAAYRSANTVPPSAVGNDTSRDWDGPPHATAVATMALTSTIAIVS
jgi:hypothetical protein